MALTFKITTRRFIYSGFLMGIMAVSSAFAEEIFKIVSENGEITYSSEPPENSQVSSVIEALPPPTEEDVLDAEKRQQKLEESNERTSQALAAQMQRNAERRSSDTTILLQPGHNGFTSPIAYPYHRPRWGHDKPGHRPPVHYPAPRQYPILNRGNG